MNFLHWIEKSIYGNAPSSLNCGQKVVEPSQELELAEEAEDFLDSDTVDVIINREYRCFIN